ncbi:hypothetical protein [Massilia sp.]|uniref:hypothetical protein n=1 Tax=Massilia sp. TaxID=1882437 RepID=UPI00352F0E6D
MRAGDHTMRPVALDIGDDLAVQANLVQVTRAIVQVVQDAAIRQRRLRPVAEFIVANDQAAGWVKLALYARILLIACLHQLRPFGRTVRRLTARADA